MNRRTLMLAAPTCLLVRPAAASVKLRDLYDRDRSASNFALDNAGRRLTVEGYMAPPLKADSTFFVLTKMPMAVCPFCETAAEWPDTIVAVYTKRVVDVRPFNRKLLTTGLLELGEFRDPETGFVSMVRLVDAVTS